MCKDQLSGYLADQEGPEGQGQVNSSRCPSSWPVPRWPVWTDWIFKQVLLLCGPQVLLIRLGKATGKSFQWLKALRSSKHAHFPSSLEVPQLGGIRGLTFASELHPSFCPAATVGIPGHLYNCSLKVPDLMTKQGGAGEASLEGGLVHADWSGVGTMEDSPVCHLQFLPLLNEDSSNNPHQPFVLI